MRTIINYRTQKTVFRGIITKDTFRGKDFSSCYIPNVNFSEFSLEGTDLSFAHIACRPLEPPYKIKGNEIAFQGTQFYPSTNCTGTYFYECDLAGALGFHTARLDFADLRYALNIPQEYMDMCANQMQQILRVLSPVEKDSLRRRLAWSKTKGLILDERRLDLVSLLSQVMGSKDDFLKRLPQYVPGMHNPAEQLFWQITSGSAPQETVFCSRNPFFSMIAELLEV